MASLNISISAEPIAHFFGLTITNSLLTGWIVTAVLAISVYLFSKTIRDKGVPTRLQSFIEFLIESLFGVVESIAGSAKAKRFFPLVGTLFIFILMSNWSGLIPGIASIGFREELHGALVFIPYWRAPTADINTTLALGLITMIMVQVYGYKYLGLKYFKKFFDFSNPINFFVGILELVSDFSKIISFTFVSLVTLLPVKFFFSSWVLLSLYLDPLPLLHLRSLLALSKPSSL
jgi:F-type H+-transporting ATPase subunit a